MASDTKQTADVGELEQLRDELVECRRELDSERNELKRWREFSGSIQLIAKTFVSLTLTERTAICDTLLALTCTQLETRRGAVLMFGEDEAEGLTVMSGRDLTHDDLLASEEAQVLWWELLDSKVPRAITAKEIATRWPQAPEYLQGGLAAVAIDVRDRSVGLIVVCDKLSGRPFVDREVYFLGGTSSIGAIALADADMLRTQQELATELEQSALLARQEASEKATALSELADKMQIIERQQFAIQELSTPILQLWDNVVALPVIGVVDTRRSVEIMERLLAEIVARQSKFVILDITGVEVVDTATADHFIKVIRASQLLGAQCIVTGIGPAVAQTLVDIGMDLTAITTMSNLQEGLKECLRRMKLQRGETRRFDQIM